MSDREHGTEDRLRDALHAKAQADDISTDAWARIRAGVNAKATRRRTAVWTSLGLAGAAAAVIAIISFAALNGGDSDKQVVDTPDGTATGFVALTNDGEIVHYDATGGNLGVVADTGWKPGSNFSQPMLTVGPDGTVFFSRAATDEACPRSEQLGTEIVSVPLEGGEPEVVVPAGTAPSVSPDGSTLAYISHPSGQQCPKDGAVLWIAEEAIILLDLETGERTVPDISYTDVDNLRIRPEGPLVWSSDGRELAANVRCASSGGECERTSVAVVPTEGGKFRDVYRWDGDRVGSALAFLDDTWLLVDTEETNNGHWIGLVDSTGSDTMIPEFIGLPHNAQLLSLSTLPGDNAPGILVTTAPDRGAPTGTTAIYSADEERPPRVVAENVMAAAWIPGTTSEDLDAEPSTPDAVAGEPTAVAVEEIPLDGSYLPGIGRTDLIAADESGVWVAVADDPVGATTRVVHVSAATETVDNEVETPDDVQGLLLVDGDLWWTSSTTVGRSGSTDFEVASSQGTTSSQGFSGILEATDSAVWTTTADRRALVSVARQGSAGTPSSDDLSVHSLSAPVQEIVALGDDLWVETDADPGTLYRFDAVSGELVDPAPVGERDAISYGVSAGTIWSLDTAGNLVPVVGKRRGDEPLTTGIPNAVFVPTDSGLVVSGNDGQQVRIYDSSLEPVGPVVDTGIPPRPANLDGPWGGMVIAGPDAWWQNALGPSILRVHLDG